MQIKEIQHINGSITYTISGYLGLNPKDGRAVNTTRAGFSSPEEALKVWKQLKSDFKDNGNKLEEKVRIPRVKDIYLDYIEWYRTQVEPSTFIKTEEIYKIHVLPFFGNFFVDKVTVIDAQNFSDELFLKYVTARKICNYASKLFEEAHRLQYVEDNVFNHVRYPIRHIKSKPNVEQNYYSKHELNLFIDALNKNVEDSNDSLRSCLQASKTRAFLSLLVMSGLRREEALALKDESIDFDKGIVTVSSAIKYAKKAYEGSTKTKSGVRKVLVDPTTLSYVNDYFERRDYYFSKMGYDLKNTEHYAFLGNRKPELLSFGEPRKMMVAICEKYGLRRITVHGLRHTQATLLYAAGAKDIDVATRLGHSNANVTRKVYVHGSDDIADNAFGILNSYLSPEK